MQTRDRLAEIILDPHDPITLDQESRWNAAYRELEDLEKLLGGNDKGVSRESVERTKIDGVLRDICQRLESLNQAQAHGSREMGDESALMLVSWELAMRIEEGILFEGLHEHI